MASQIIHGPWVGNYRVVMALESGAVSIPNNTTSVNSKAYIESRNGSSFYGISAQIGHALNEQIVNSYTTTPTIPVNAQILISNVTRSIPHNANGTKTVTTSASFNSAITGALHASGSMALPDIPRATTAIWETQTPTPEFGETRRLVLNRAAPTFTHDVTWECGTRTGTVGMGIGTSVDFAIPLDLSEEFPNSTRGILTFTTVTKNGGSTIGTRTSATTLLVPQSVVPSVTQVRWQDTNTTVLSKIGAFVQGLSIVTGSVDAEEAYGSPISSKSLLVSGTRLPEGVPIQLNAPGTVEAFGEATDSRGRTATKAANLNVLPYTPPTIGSGGWKVSRANTSNVATDLGTYLRLDLHAVAKSLVVGTEKNSLTVKVYTKPTNSGAWADRNVINPGLVHTGAIQVSGGAAFPVSESFDLRIELTDKTGISPTVLQTTVPTATVTLDLSGVNVGIGKYHQQGALDVGGDVYASGSVRSRNGGIDSPTGMLVPYAGPLPPTGWLLCDGGLYSKVLYPELFGVLGYTYGGSGTMFGVPSLKGRTVVGVNTADTEFSSLGKTFGTKTHTLTEAQMPGHTHGPGGAGTNFTTYRGSGGQIGTTPGATLDFTTITASRGGGGAHNNIQPSIAMNYIIRT